VPSNTNTRELFEWMHQHLSATTTSRILVGDAVVTATVQNVFDKDPPFAYSPFNYDCELASPLGRVLEVNVKKRF
jgi:outer membrane receptor protein involved in Fe transport